MTLPRSCSVTQLSGIQASLDSPLCRSLFRLDPLSRCAAVSLPGDTIAVLSFIQIHVDLDVMDQDQLNRYVAMINLRFISN